MGGETGEVRSSSRPFRMKYMLKKFLFFNCNEDTLNVIHLFPSYELYLLQCKNNRLRVHFDLFVHFNKTVFHFILKA